MLREGHIKASPAARLQNPKVPKKAPRFPRHSRSSSCCGTAPPARMVPNPKPSAAGAHLRCWTPCFEAVSLDTTALDLRNNLVRVMGKGSKERIVPFGPPAADALRAWLSEIPKEGMFLESLRQTPEQPVCLDHHPRVWRHKRYLGVASPRPTAQLATHLLGAGADLRAIQEQLGHASLLNYSAIHARRRGPLARCLQVGPPSRWYEKGRLIACQRSI